MKSSRVVLAVHSPPERLNQPFPIPESTHMIDSRQTTMLRSKRVAMAMLPYSKILNGLLHVLPEIAGCEKQKSKRTVRWSETPFFGTLYLNQSFGRVFELDKYTEG